MCFDGLGGYGIAVLWYCSAISNSMGLVVSVDMGIWVYKWIGCRFMF